MWGKKGTANQTTENNIIRHMRTACWKTKATDNHSEYVILTAFSKATAVTRTCPNLKLHVNCLSSFIFNLIFLSLLIFVVLYPPSPSFLFLYFFILLYSASHRIYQNSQFERQAKPSQAKVLLAIPAFDRKAGLSNSHLNSNR